MLTLPRLSVLTLAVAAPRQMNILRRLIGPNPMLHITRQRVVLPLRHSRAGGNPPAKHRKAEMQSGHRQAAGLRHHGQATVAGVGRRTGKTMKREWWAVVDSNH